MSNKSWVLFGIGAGAGLALLSASMVNGSERERYEHERQGEREAYSRGFTAWGGPDLPPVTNESYRAECGSCHFAYQPALLPERSWRALMADLSNHFGEDASLAPETVKALEQYLIANAGDSGNAGRGERIANSVRGETPLRITATRYFQRKHHEVPDRLVRGNPEVGSFSRCAACHTRADEGRFDEHEVRIPGVGRWED